MKPIYVHAGQAVTLTGGALWGSFFTSATRVLAAALFAVVVLDPWAVLAPGFWLSFGAVAVILFASLHRVGAAHWLRGWARTQWAVTLGLVPLLLVLFRQFSLVSPLANAFAIPIVGLGVVPLTLAGMLMPFDALLELAHALMSACMAALTGLAAIPGGVWQQHAVPTWAAVAAVAGAVWLLLPRGFPARGLGIVAMLPVFLARPAAPAEGELRLTVLDVGRGAVAIARTARHALLYDAGPGAGAGDRVVVPFLRASGVRKLDGLVVTQDDVDRYGGAVSVARAMPVAWLMSPLPQPNPLHFELDRILRCQAGMRWVWDGVRFEVLHPPAARGRPAPVDDHDRSCVLRISTRAGRVLLAADIGRRTETRLLAHDARALAAEVLVAPREGGKTSSSPAFVRAVRARAVIFPVGYRNRFGHPSEVIRARYRASGAVVYRTDEDGAVAITMRAGGGIGVECARAVYRHYWQDVPRAGGACLDGALGTFLQ